MPEGPPGGARPRAWLLVAGWAVLIVLLSSIPDVGERLPDALGFPGSELVAHAVVYGVLGALLAYATGRWSTAVVIASAFGALDETYQGLVPGRNPSAVDWLVDTIAAAVGAFAALRYSRRRREPR